MKEFCKNSLNCLECEEFAAILEIVKDRDVALDFFVIFCQLGQEVI